MKFWRITSPPSQSDYAFTFINGTVSHPDSMSGVICDVCGQTWATWRYVGVPAPPVIKRRKGDVAPLRLEQFEALRADAEREIGDVSLRLMPGDRFSPAIVNIPSVPRSELTREARAEIFTACLTSLKIG